MSTVWRVRTAITGGPGGAELSTHYFDTSAGTAQDAADAVRAFWADCSGVIDGSYHFTVEPLVYTIDLTTGQAIATTTTSTTAVTGGSGTDPLPPATQALIRWHTGAFTGGRELIGKTYIPGMVENYNAAGIPTSTLLTTLTTACNNLGSGGPPNLVIWSRKHHLTAPAGLGSVWNQWAVLRSRRS